MSKEITFGNDGNWTSVNIKLFLIRLMSSETLSSWNASGIPFHIALCLAGPHVAICLRLVVVSQVVAVLLKTRDHYYYETVFAVAGGVVNFGKIKTLY